MSNNTRFISLGLVRHSLLSILFYNLLRLYGFYFGAFLCYCNRNKKNCCMEFVWRRINKDIFDVICLSTPAMHYFFLFFFKFYSNFFILYFILIFVALFRANFKKVYGLFTKMFRNFLSYNVRNRKSNVFVNVAKSNRVILSRSLGTLGFRKNKKKMHAHPAYLMGKRLVKDFKERLVKPIYKKIYITIKGFKRFFRSSMSNQFHFTRKTRYKHTGVVRKQKKWLIQKGRFLSRIRLVGKIGQKCLSYGVRKLLQKKSKIENKLKKEITRLRNILLRPIFVQSYTSVPFGGVKPRETKLFSYSYIKRN